MPCPAAASVAACARRGMDPNPREEQVLAALTAKAKGQIGSPRMDLVVHDGAARLLIDVTVVSPLAGDAGHIDACARREGHACRRAAAFKRGKYPHKELVPFAVETGGRLGTDARARA